MNRSKSVNNTYFDTVNINQAWLMGFIAADGTISKDKNLIKIGLSSQDREILEKIKAELKIAREIHDSCTNNGYAVSELAWSSKNHKDFLAKYGIVNNKTYHAMQVPNFTDKKLILAFILGYMDGDGSISINENKYLRIRIVAHRSEILQSIVDNLSTFYPNLTYSLSQDSRKLYELSISTLFAVPILKDMYNLNSLRLDRKYKKFLEYINHETATS